MEVRRKRPMESPPGLLSLLDDRFKCKKAFLGDRAGILTRTSSVSNSLFLLRKCETSSPFGGGNNLEEGLGGVSWQKRLFSPGTENSLGTSISSPMEERLHPNQGQQQQEQRHKSQSPYQQEHQEQKEQERQHKPLESSLQRLTLSNVPASSHVTSGKPSSDPTDEEPVWKKLLKKAQGRDKRIDDLASKIDVEESSLKNLQETRTAFEKLSIKELSAKKEAIAFIQLTEKEEEEVRQALNGVNKDEVLVQHQRSNIDLTRSLIQCLKPGVWLNDDVINLYLELLKERELQAPEKFLKCHFFNTFFYNKLYNSMHSYDYKAVRRWTTLKKLGYNVLHCDKIFVPIHKDTHWCLAVINMKEKKIQYFDSLKGHDENVFHVLAKYVQDEAKDKLNQDLNTTSWELDCPKDIPEQLNGCDCGMFMLKYVDFHSRGDDLKFSQEHMEYFRKRTVLELLRLKAV